MAGERILKDGESFEFDPSGRLFKAYCPARDGACVRLQSGVYRFDLKGGDRSTLDGNRVPAPNRSQIAGYGASSRMEPGSSTVMRFGHLIEPPEGGRLTSFHLNIGQWQSTGDAGEYHTPPMSIEVSPVSRANNDHIVEVATTTLPGRNTAGQVAKAVIQGAASYQVGRVNWFDIEFKDSLGAPGGWLKACLNGSKFVDYVGPTSRDNAAGIYPGWGLYRNDVPQDLVGYLIQPEYGEA